MTSINFVYVCLHDPAAGPGGAGSYVLFRGDRGPAA